MKGKEKNTRNELTCPNCGSKSLIKKGKRQNKNREVQLYFCKDCEKRFSDDKFKNKTYSVKDTIKALSLYNSGLTIEETASKTKIPRSTIANWLQENRKLFNLSKFSKEVQAFSRENKIIEGHKYIHQLVYLYLQNSFKLQQFVKNKEPKLYDYLETAKQGKINQYIFRTSDARASQLKLNIINELNIKKLNNNACKFANIAVELVKDNKSRHWAVEKTMLENDTSTIATEVPVFLQISKSTIPWVKKIESKNDYITGHIDLLQYRNNKLYILDYKPNAEKEKPLGQLFVYACCLSKAVRIPFSRMKLAWFDEKVYFEADAMNVYRTVMQKFKI